MAANLTTIQRYTLGGHIYFGVTTPANKTLMTHTAGVPTGGTDAGATVGVATAEYRPTIQMTDIEQVFGMVAPRMTAEDMTLKFTVVEATYTNIGLALTTGTQSTDGSNNIIKYGGKTAIV